MFWNSLLYINYTLKIVTYFHFASFVWSNLLFLFKMQGGFGSFSAVPSLTVLQEEILWFWPWNPVLHQWELGVAAPRRGIDISSFKHHDEMLLNVACSYAFET